MQYDVLIVGAGPAGARAARLLAERGCKTLLLEKAELPRPKTCAGGLTRRAQKECGIDPAPWVAQWVSGIRCRVPRDSRIDLHTQNPPMVGMVRRGLFDQALVQAAAAAGAEVRERTRIQGIEEKPDRVVLTTTRGSFGGSFLIGADGAAGISARSNGFQVRAAFNPALEAEFRPRDGRLPEPLKDRAFYDFCAVPGGYAWIFPKGDHFSVGICSTFSRIKRIMPYFRSFVESQPLLGHCDPEPARGWLIPLGTRGGSVATRRCLLAGDAAGCVDPLTGEGIYYALKSGALAAEAVVQALQANGKPNLVSYQQAMNREIYTQLRLASLFARIIYRMPGFALSRLLGDERVARHYLALIDGEETYQDMIRHFFRHGWRLLAKPSLND